MTIKGELHRFSTWTYIEELHERTFSAKCECTVQFRSQEITRNFCTNSLATAILNTSLVAARGEGTSEEWRTVCSTLPVEPLMAAEELAAYRELVTDARKIQMDKTKKEMTETAESATVGGAHVDVV